ncbi:MAG: NUDIX domain-containing protein [Patescibacteria group bacterium]
MRKKDNSNSWIADNKYKEFMEELPICTVDILFFNHNKQSVLLLKRVNKPLKNAYFSPGGRMIKNETFEDCAVRQAKTELGLKIDKKKLVFGGVINEIHKESIYPKTNYHCVNVYFGYVLTKTKIKLDSQHSSAEWFLVGNKKLHPLIKAKIKSFIKI